MFDPQLNYDPTTIRWMCVCGRTSPRHPSTRTRDMNPAKHSFPDGFGECSGPYRAQKLAPCGDLFAWVDDVEAAA